MRQRVLSVPFTVRHLFATHPAVVGQVLGEVDSVYADSTPKGAPPL